MAEKRMFSKTIIDSDSFLDMSHDTQLLYFHLAMRADDDGFVNNAKRILRTIGCNDDDLKMLFAKQFVIPFESGVVVIKHWKIHNYIQKDRYKETLYQYEKSMLTEGADKSYELGYEMDTNCIQVGHKTDTQIRLDKNSIDKISTDKNSTNRAVKSELDQEFETLWSLYPKKQGKQKAKTCYLSARKKGTSFEEVEDGIKRYCDYIESKKVDTQYIKQGSTFFSQQAWQDEYEAKQEYVDDGTWGDVFK